MPHGFAISSMSLGRAWVHDFPSKLARAAAHNYGGIEVFYEDLSYHAKALFPNASDPLAAEIAAAHDIRQMCASANITIICLQPFLQYDGLVDRADHEEKIKKLHHWFNLAPALGTDVIQIPANFLPEPQCSSDINLIASDLQKVADLGAKQQPPIKFAYEALCWSTYIDTWEASWDVVKRVDRANFGLCLDTFNITGRIYADPAAKSGKTENAEKVVEASLKKLVAEVPADKVFFIQVVDAERLDEPLVEGHPYYDAEQRTRMSWSRNCRLFYGETDRGAYLPVRAVTEAIIHGIGYQGWVSMELFSRTMNDPSPSVPEDHARRGAVAWKKLVEDIGLDYRFERADSPVGKEAEKANGTTTASQPQQITVA